MAILKTARNIFLGSILIVHELLEDKNNKNKDLKVKIYYIALKTMLQHTYLSLPFINFKKKETLIRLQYCLSIKMALY